MRQCSVLSAAFLFMVGCSGGPDNDVVARAGKLELTRGELLASISYASPEDSLTVSAIYIEDWRDLAAMYQLALEDGVDKDPDTRMLIEKAARQITVQRFVDKKMGKGEAKGLFAVDSSAVSAVYREFPDDFICRETQYAVARYYAVTEQAASRMQNALKLHEGDEAEIRKLIESIEPGYAGANLRTRRNPPRLKTIAQMHLENRRMKDFLKNMTPGELSPVIAVHDSLFVVMEMHGILEKGDKKTLEQAYRDIEELLIVEKQKQYYSKLLEQAREKYQ